MAAAPTEPTREVTPDDLPDGFVLGVASAAHQIEGAVTADGRGRSIWDAYALQPEAIADGTSGAVACDHYRRWQDDLDLLAELGVDSYRFSIAWPRIQPTGRGRPLQAGLDFYDRLVDGLLERGIRPNATLYHWDLPAALEDDLGGWRHRDTAGRFADYAVAVAERLADRVEWWATIDEPWCAAFLGYERAVHAPGEQDEAGSIRAAHHLLVAHGMAAQALRAAGATGVGVVCNLEDVAPATDREGDRDAAERVDAVQNRYWLGSLAGTPPPDVAASFTEVVEPELLHRDGDDALIAQPLDWLGVTTGRPQVVATGDDVLRRPAGPGLDGVVKVPAGDDEPASMLGWRIGPARAATVLRQAHDHLPDVPIMVTGNGLALPDAVVGQDRIDDEARVAYLTDHLAAMLDTRTDGVPLQGYHVWSLLDGFEWAHGYAPRFGLVHVDHETQERTPKGSFHWFADLARGR